MSSREESTPGQAWIDRDPHNWAKPADRRRAEQARAALQTQVAEAQKLESALGRGTTFHLYLRDAVVLALESGGYTALTDADGTEALDVLQGNAEIIELVITDLNMPVRGGAELIDDLAIAHPNLPVIVVSGYSSSENTDLPPDVLFVPKPFSSKMLLACVRQALDDR